MPPGRVRTLCVPPGRIPTPCVAHRNRVSAFEAEEGRFEPCGYTVRGRAVTTTNATHTSDMNPKPTTSNMSMVLPEERASPLRGWGRRGRLYRFDRLRGVGAGPPARHAPTGASLPQRAARVCRSEDRGYLNSALAFGRIAQRGGASAFEAEGCSCGYPSHHRPNWPSDREGVRFGQGFTKHAICQKYRP